MQSPTTDTAAKAILRELTRDARISMRQLGAAVGLSPPAVTDRVRRLEDLGVIRGYRAAIDYARLGHPIAAFISMTARDGRCDELEGALTRVGNVLAVYHVAGPSDFLVRVVARDVEELKAVTDRLAGFGSVSTQVILGTILERDLEF